MRPRASPRASSTWARSAPARRAGARLHVGHDDGRQRLPTTSATSSTDNAGHVAIATITVTVANAAPRHPRPSARRPRSTGATVADTTAPDAPTKLSVILPRAKVRAPRGCACGCAGSSPTAPDLDRVVVVLNRKRTPKGPGDGTVIYRGLGTSAGAHAAGRAARVRGAVRLRPQRTTSRSRRAGKISLASLIPLRPLTGSVVTEPPLLTWKAKQDSCVLQRPDLPQRQSACSSAWPSRASYRRARWARSSPGTYVWFVWPASESATRHARRSPI